MILKCLEEKLNQNADKILEPFWNLQAYWFKEMQILYKQNRQIIEMKAHEKYKTNSIFIP